MPTPRIGTRASPVAYRPHRRRRWLLAAWLLAAAGCGGSRPATAGMPPACDPLPWSGDDIPRLRVPFDAADDPAVAASGLSAVPTLLNEPEVRSALVEEFVSVMLDREPVPTGTVRYWLLVGADGAIEAEEIAESSGDASLDGVAERVVRLIELTPAVRRECRVPVWVLYPVRFEARGTVLRSWGP